MATTASDLSLALGKHRYRTPNGEIAVSVTAISGFIDDGKSAAFAGAAMKLGPGYRSIWKAKADRGTRVHGHLEKFLTGEDIDQADDEKGFVDALEKFIIEHEPAMVEQEAIVLSDLGYGGRFDLLATLADDDHQSLGLIDLKTGSPYAVEHTLQLSAYRYADGIATYDEDGNLSNLRPLPQIDWTACLYVADDGTYRLVRYPADETAFRAFCALLEAYKWTRTDAMKAEVKASKERK